MVRGNDGNQFRQYARQNAGNLTGYNDVQNIGNLVIQNALQNPRVQNVGNQNGLIDGSVEVHENCDDNEIFNMFTQEEQYTELLEPIPESHQVPQNDNNVISEDTSVEQGGERVEQHPVNFKETRSDIEFQEKKAKLFNEWEMFTSNEEELIESYYHRFLKLMNDLKRNKHFPEKIASNLKFLNNLQPE
nr:hypothetical protein [Tanacetum cinerariifolium]